MEWHFLGTGAGTEPIKGVYHQSTALCVKDNLYFFDCGEGCSRRAHLNDINILETKAVFITHTHMDHVGGLGNLLWNMRKIHSNENYLSNVCDKKIYIPNIETFDAFMTILKNTEGGYNISFDVSGIEYSSGEIYRDECIKVIAFANSHMGDSPAQSFSFRILCENKSIVISGDLKNLDELDSPIGDGCDMLVCETGHFALQEVCEYARSKNVEKLCFSHNCRYIINNVCDAMNSSRNLFGDSVFIARDSMKFTL